MINNCQQQDLAVVVFPDRPGDVLVEEGEMLQEVWKRLTKMNRIRK